jgi:hypothetical protein
MKAKLTFNLPDDQDEFDNAINGSKAHLALWQISQNIRAIWKHGDLNDSQYEVVNRIRDEFFEVIHEHGIKLD